MVSLISRMSEDKFKIEIKVPFQSERVAQIAYDALRVDKEPKRSNVTKVLRVEDNMLIANFSAQLARQLRTAINGYFEKLDLIASTVELLGPPVSNHYNHY